jgi:hypothetical protein
MRELLRRSPHNISTSAPHDYAFGTRLSNSDDPHKSPIAMDPEKVTEDIQVLEPRERLANEVYGTGDDLETFSRLGLTLRKWIRRFSVVEENGIERIPPEARIDQNPRGTSCLLNSGLMTRSHVLLLECELLSCGFWNRYLRNEYLRPWMVGFLPYNSFLRPAWCNWTCAPHSPRSEDGVTDDDDYAILFWTFAGVFNCVC